MRKFKTFSSLVAYNYRCPSNAAKFSLSINATMGLRLELHFHKATEFLTSETDVSQFQTAGQFCLSAVSGIINKVNQQLMIKLVPHNATTLLGA